MICSQMLEVNAVVVIDAMAKTTLYKWTSTGNRLRIARSRAGFTQKAVAEQLDVKEQMVWYWEAGRSRPNQDHLVALGSILGVTVDWLLEGDAKLIRETPGIYEAGEPPPTEAEARLLREFLRFIRQQRQDGQGQVGQKDGA